MLIADDVRFDQYFGRVDHVLGSTQRLSVRWIGEHQRDEGGTSSSAATLGRALRGSRGPFDGFFGNLNVGAQQIFGRAVNDARVSYQIINTTRGDADAVVPTINITGITAPFGDVFESTTRLRTFELRDVLTLERGQHALRVGGEVRRITKGLSIGPPTAGSFTFTSLAELRRRSTVPPAADRRSGHRRADRLPALFHAVRDGPVHPGSVDDQPASEPQPRAAPRLLRHRDRGRRPAVVDRPRPGRHLPRAARRRESRARRSPLRAGEDQLLAAHRPGLGSVRQRPDVDPQRLQPGLPAAPRTVDLRRARAAARRARRRHPAVEQHRHADPLRHSGAVQSGVRPRSERIRRRPERARRAADPHHRLRRQPDDQDAVHRELVPERAAPRRASTGSSRSATSARTASTSSASTT